MMSQYMFNVDPSESAGIIVPVSNMPTTNTAGFSSNDFAANEQGGSV